MKKKGKKNLILIVIILLPGIISLIQFSNLVNLQINEQNDKVPDLKLNNVDFTNATVISDGFNGIYWNDGGSWQPQIAVDKNGTIHAVWYDGTHGLWGIEYEIMYASYTEASGWSNVTVISDGYNNIYWNDGYSYQPKIAVDNDNKVHVVWYDNGPGIWREGSVDYEIMYASYTEASGWSNVTVISDGYNGIYWNDDQSLDPDLAIDNNGTIHVVWSDYTDGSWGTDEEIMYVSYTETSGWSNVTVISDGYNGIYWNDMISRRPDIAVDSLGNIHVVWEDETIGIWTGALFDWEIMHVTYTEASGWLNVTVISDGFEDIYWNDGYSMAPQIAVDDDDNVHVVWEDETDGLWGTDQEIMYSTLQGSKWSFPKVISDGFEGVYWNDGQSQKPSIAIDSSGNIHVVWQDDTNGGWGIDTEIMYSYYSEKTGWILPKVISDGYQGNFWNTGDSYYPAIAYGNEEIHVIWRDTTDGVWGMDDEIMYSSISVKLAPSIFTLSTDAKSPDSDGMFDLIWTESEGTETYSVYRHSSYISIINSSVNLLQSGLTTPLLNLTGYASGTYYFIIEAENEVGSCLSNCLSVEVQITSGGGIPFGNFYLIFSLIGVVGLIIYIRRKL
ncbi:MAG: hypothetical protein ACFFDH_18260 [Promethearchaeota archaeon]